MADAKKTEEERVFAARVIAELEKGMGSRLRVDVSDSDFVTDMAEAIREASKDPDGPRPASDWHMAARKWGHENGEMQLLATMLWWKGDGRRSEVVATFVDQRGFPERFLLSLEKPPGERKRVVEAKHFRDACFCKVGSSVTQDVERGVYLDQGNIIAFCCPQHGPTPDTDTIREEGVEEGRAINQEELAELDELRQAPRLTERECDYLADVFRDMRAPSGPAEVMPSTNLVSAMERKTDTGALGEGGATRLAKKLEGGHTQTAACFRHRDRAATIAYNDMWLCPECEGNDDLVAHIIFYGNAHQMLVEKAGARPEDRQTFIHYFLEDMSRAGTKEYRVQGRLGFGGKFWRRGYDNHDVTCYPEDRSKELDAVITALNAAFKGGVAQAKENLKMSRGQE